MQAARCSAEAVSYTRMDLAGPWVDIDVYRRVMGERGATLNLPISLKTTAVVKPISRMVKRSGPSGSRVVESPDDKIVMVAKDLGYRAVVEAEQLESMEVDDALKIAASALKRLDIGSGWHIETSSEAPAGSGVGSSSAMAISVIRALTDAAGVSMTFEDVINLARRIETEDLEILGGWQDFYPAAYGPGVHFMIWEGGKMGGNLHEQVIVPKGFISELNARSVFVYSGKSRLSGDIHQHVNVSLQTKGSVRNAFDKMTHQAFQMRDAFREGNIEDVCQLVNQSWHCQKMLHESVTNREIDGMFETAFDNGAVAGKAGGAGGGGCLLFLTATSEDKPQMIGAIEEHIKSHDSLEEALVLDCQFEA